MDDSSLSLDLALCSFATHGLWFRVRVMDGDEAGRRVVGATATARDRWGSHTRSPRLYDTIVTNESANTCRDSPQRGMVRWLQPPRELCADDAVTTQEQSDNLSSSTDSDFWTCIC